MDTQTLYDLRIEDADDGTVVATNGVVSTNGGSAVIYDWDDERGKPRQVDRLTDCQIKRSTKDTTLLVGTSQELVRVVGIDKEKALRTLRLLHNRATKPGAKEVV